MACDLPKILEKAKDAGQVGDTIREIRELIDNYIIAATSKSRWIPVLSGVDQQEKLTTTARAYQPPKLTHNNKMKISGGTSYV